MNTSTVLLRIRSTRPVTVPSGPVTVTAFCVTLAGSIASENVTRTTADGSTWTASAAGERPVTVGAMLSRVVKLVTRSPTSGWSTRSVMAVVTWTV